MEKLDSFDISCDGFDAQKPYSSRTCFGDRFLYQSLSNKFAAESLAHYERFDFSFVSFENEADKPYDSGIIGGNPKLSRSYGGEMSVKVILWMLSANSCVLVDLAMPLSQLFPQGPAFF
jgi:hypothetical protein